MTENPYMYPAFDAQIRILCLGRRTIYREDGGRFEGIVFEVSAESAGKATSRRIEIDLLLWQALKGREARVTYLKGTFETCVAAALDLMLHNAVEPTG